MHIYFGIGYFFKMLPLALKRWKEVLPTASGHKATEGWPTKYQSWLLSDGFFSQVPPKPGAALTPSNWQQPQIAAFDHTCSNHSHLLIRSCKMTHTCPVPSPCQPVILPILLWSHGSTCFRSLLPFFFFFFVYAHQDRRV